MDLKIVETLNGGDLVKGNKDLVTINGLGNMPYLALFGGNTAASTPVRRLESEQAFDWWGNELLMGNDRDLQFNSETERALIFTPLTSAGRRIIENAVRTDLKFMKEFARVAVAVAIIATDRIAIAIRIEEPDNLERRDFIFIWDATRGELEERVPNLSGPSALIETNGFDYTFDFTFI